MVCGVLHTYAEPGYVVAGFRNLKTLPYQLSSAESLPATLELAAMLFGFRVRRQHIPNDSDSPAIWPGQQPPGGWLANKDVWLTEGHPGSRNNGAFVTSSSEPAKAIT